MIPHNAQGCIFTHRHRRKCTRRHSRGRGGGRKGLSAGHGTKSARAQVASMLSCRTSSGLAGKCKSQLLCNAEVCQRRWEFHPAHRGHPENSGGRRQVNGSENDWLHWRLPWWWCINGKLFEASVRPRGWGRPSSQLSQHPSPAFEIDWRKVNQTQSPYGWCLGGWGHLDVLMLVVPQGEHETCTCIRNVDIFFAVLHENEIRATALYNPRQPAQNMRRNVQAKKTCD